MSYHSIVCVLGCTGDCCDCPCHDSESDGDGRAYGRLSTANEAAPGTVLVTPTEGLATTPTERPKS